MVYDKKRGVVFMKFGKFNFKKSRTDEESVSVNTDNASKSASFADKVKKIRTSKKSRRILIIALAVIIAVSAFGVWFIKSRKTTDKSGPVTAEVTRGSISNVIEGTGTVEAISQYEVTSLAKGDVIADYFEEGDYVEKDQLLYKMDSSSIDKSIQKQKTSIEKAKMNYDDAAQNISDLNVKATAGGVITNMYVSVGDNVQNGAKIADIIDKDNLVLKIPFGADDAVHIYSGESATVTLANSFTTLYGSVKSVGTGSYVNSYGVNVTDVEISFSNPGTVSEGEKATAMIGSYACYDSGSIEYLNSKTVTAKVSGEVSKIVKKKGDKVNNGDTVVTLTSTSVQKSAKEARISLSDANLSLDDLYDNLDDYSITSPIKGKVIQKNIKAGEKMDSNSSSTMAIIADLSTLTFDMSIDELDISSISVGQKVSITADAIEGKTFTGEVSNISIVGESYQGVTSYPVTVTIDNSEESDLIPGMNVTAQIVVESVEDVLRIPVSAVRMGNFVIVKDDGTFTSIEDSIKAMPNPNENGKNPENRGGSENDDDNMPEGERQAPPDMNNPPQGDSPNGKEISSLFGTTKVYAAEDEKTNENRMQNMLKNLEVPEGYTVVMVETGLSDGSFIEIKEKDGGLKEGDTILLPDTTASKSSDDDSQQGMGMPGGMGGGMPGGGMPGGGNRGGGMPGGNRGGQR